MPTNGTDGLQFFDLSHPWGHHAPLWPYFPDVKIERFHYHAKSGVLSQQITTFMHCTTHTDAPAHVIEGTEFMDEVALSKYFGTGVPGEREGGTGVEGGGRALKVLGPGRRRLTPKEKGGVLPRGGPRDRPAGDPGGRHRHRHPGGAPPLRRQPQVLRRVARHLQ